MYISASVLCTTLDTPRNSVRPPAVSRMLARACMAKALLGDTHSGDDDGSAVASGDKIDDDFDS